MTTHTMTLIERHEGTEEWYCPICGRHTLLEFHSWRRVVLEAGDTTVAHTGFVTEIEKE
jgi:hypothetical protein